MKRFRYIVAILFIVLTLSCVGCGSNNVRIDKDFSKLTSYAIQSEVQKMQKASTAGDYLGQTIKMRAIHKASGDYHYIVGPDGDECCNWEVEIKLSDSVNSYPKTNKSIYVTGEYKYYKKSGKTYYYLSLLDFT